MAYPQHGALHGSPGLRKFANYGPLHSLSFGKNFFKTGDATFAFVSILKMFCKVLPPFNFFCVVDALVINYSCYIW